MVCGCLQAHYAPLSGDYEQVEGRNALKEFLASLDTGDLLVYKSKGFSASIVRSVTWSDWDHVGVVVRRKKDTCRTNNVDSKPATNSARKCDPKYCSCTNGVLLEDSLEILEATAAGVHIYPLEERIARRLHHDSFIGVRKLKGYDRTDIDADVEAFIRDTRGNGYAFTALSTWTKIALRARGSKKSSTRHFNLEKTVAEETVDPIHENPKNEAVLDIHTPPIQKDRQFCSGLVASFLCFLGVFTENTICDYFSPAHFSSSDSAMLKSRIKGNYEYSAETVILEPGRTTNRQLYRMLLSEMKKRVDKQISTKIIPSDGRVGHTYLKMSNLKEGSPNSLVTNIRTVATESVFLMKSINRRTGNHAGTSVYDNDPIYES